MGVDVGDRDPGQHVHAELLQLFLRLGREVFGERGQHPRAGLDQPHPRLGRVDAAELVLQRVPGDLRQGAGQLDPGGAAADDGEAEPGRARGGVGFRFGTFERQQQVPAQLQRVVQGLQAGCVRGPVVVTEIGMGGAGGDQQVVVGQRLPIGQAHLPRLLVDVDDFPKAHFDVVLVAQDLPQRRGDVRGRQAGGGDLVQQRLEQVMVAAVDQGDVQRRPGQSAGGPQAGEATADHDQVRHACVVHAGLQEGKGRGGVRCRRGGRVAAARRADPLERALPVRRCANVEGRTCMSV
ncbi:hypothetical protein NB706_003565 [Xanthomonas sacchari]|nr:hypothetical protein [Xanthomonas sacchari]